MSEKPANTNLRTRNLVTLLLIVAFAVLVYAIAIIKMKGA